MGILRILLIFVFALIPFGQIVRVEILTGVIISPLDIAVLFLSSYLLTQLILGRITFRFEKFHYFLLLFIAIGLLSLLFQFQNLSIRETISAFGYAVRFVLYIIPLFLLPSVVRDKGLLLIKDLIFVGLIFVFFGILQYIYLPRLELLIFLGEWDIHSFRLFSTFFDPNYAGIFIVFEILLLSALFLLQKQRKLLYMAIIVCCYISLFLTYSRSSMVALAAGVVVYLILLKKYKILMVFIGFFAVSVFVLALYSRQFGGEGVKVFRTASIHTRLSSYQEGFSVLAKNPLIGSGFNSYKYARRDFVQLDKYDLASNASNSPSNSFIFVLATTGISGFVCFVLFLFFLLSALFKLHRSSKSKTIVAAVISSIAALLVHSLFQNTFFYAPIVIVYVLMIVGVFSNSTREST